MYTTAISYPSAGEVNTRMAAVYRNMFLAVMTSFVVSWYVASTTSLYQFFMTGVMMWITIFAPLVFIFLVPILLNAGIPKPAKHLILHGFAAVMGLSMSTVFKVYTGMSIFNAFMGAAVLFGTLSVYGYFTKQNLDSIGKYAIIALIAIIVASIINIFVGSTVLQMIVSAIAIVVFLALTAYDTQKIREQIYDNVPDVEVTGALSLYLDFINIFMNLLQLFGNKNE